MTQTLTHFPGQKVTIFLTTNDGYGSFVDGYFAPQVSRIIAPDFSTLPNYPQLMTKFDTGLFYFQFTLPQGASAVGSFFIDVEYDDPSQGFLTHKTYQVIVTAPFGNFSATIGN
jgi:hypothetical protein